MGHRIKGVSVLSQRERNAKRSFNNINAKSRQLLHSNRCAYFYKHKASKSSGQNYLRSTRSFGISVLPLVFSSLALLVVLGWMMNPSSTSHEAVYAEEGIAGQADIPTSGVALSIDTTLSDDNTVTEQVSGSGTQYISVDFSVGANDIDKYQVFVQADSTNLVGYTNKDVITTVAAPTSGGDIGAKQWGYSVAKNHGINPATLTYNTIQTGASVPADNVEAASGSKLTNINQPYTLAFAANLDGAKADHYKSNITLSVAANAEEVATNPELLGFENLTYMQDMADYKCYAAKIGETKQLIDSRDGKKYWVSKLKDGNCWMTQNLDLDITSAGLKANDTDISADWTPETGETTLATGDLSATTWPNDDNLTRSYDPGEYVYTAGTGINNCGEGQSSLGNCTGFELVTGKNASNDFNFSTTPSSTEYNSHYTVGNYYNYNMATVETGAGLSGNNEDATGSICPKGWQLPYSGRAPFYAAGSNDAGNLDINNNIPTNRNKSFLDLLEAYGWDGWNYRDQWGNPYHNGLTGTINDITTNIAASPLYFLRSGPVYNSSLNWAGINGYYWSSTTATGSFSYYLSFNSADVFPAYHSSRFLGFSVRCVAR